MPKMRRSIDVQPSLRGIERYVLLTTVTGSFHGRVIAARLSAEGIDARLDGSTDGPYPLPGVVRVLVAADQLPLAREVLLADDVDAVFIDQDPPLATTTPPRAAWSRWLARRRESR